MNIIQYYKSKILSRIERWLSPGYSTCERCNRPWTFVKSHTTQYSKQRGCFPLCRECWGDLSIEMRLGYYRLLWLSWGGESVNDDHKWELIERAVKAGK